MNILNKIDNKLYLTLNPWFREKLINPWLRKRLKNKEITLLCNNCNGACILHDLNLPFNSPFVNLWMLPTDFLKYCSDIQHYRECILHFLPEESDKFGYPVALLDDVKIYFQHYKTNSEAQQKWDERSKRIKSDNIFVLWVAKDGYTNEDIKMFRKLSYPKAALFKDKVDIENGHYISGFEKQEELGLLMDYIPHTFFGKKHYDYFDYVSWFNKGKNE